SYYWIKNIRLTHLLVLIIPLILIPIHFFFESRPTDFVQHEWITTWDIFNFYKREFTTVDGIMHYTFPNAVYAFFAFFHPGFFFLGGGLIFLTLKKVKTIITADWIILLSGVVFYSVFLMGIPFQNNRFLLLTYPLVIALIYPGFDWLINRFLPFKRWFFGVFIIFQLGFFARAIQVSFQLCLLEKNIVSQLTHFQNQTLYSFDIDVAIEGRGLEFNYKNLWVEEYKYFEKGALVLFNEEKLKFQWEGKNPMVNWNNLKENYQLTNIKQLDGGWKLYRIGE
ncbi:MAG: hypothetical protein HRT73_10285, partial [Flavobacteriales bacterium]|nr:hypothetical protein [Flavobacteriales bacterium]